MHIEIGSNRWSLHVLHSLLKSFRRSLLEPEWFLSVYGLH